MVVSRAVALVLGFASALCGGAAQASADQDTEFTSTTTAGGSVGDNVAQGGVPPGDPQGAAAAANDQVGAAVAATDNITVIGMPNYGSTGAVLVSPRGMPSYVLRPSGPGDKFGSAVAVAADGTIAVGAPASLSGSGRVFVYAPSATSPQTINPPLATPTLVAQAFGSAVAFDESNTLVIGAPDSDTPGNADAGAVFLYQRTVVSFVPTASVPAPAPRPGDKFGSAVDASSGTVVVGAPGLDVAGQPDAGGIYVFDEDAGVPSPGQQMEPMTGIDPRAGDAFGSSVAVAPSERSDPTEVVVVVGAPGDDTPLGGDAGSAVVMLDSRASDVPVVVAVLDAPLPTGSAFGADIDTNGGTVLVGAPTADVGPTVDQGRSLAFDISEAVARAPDLALRAGGGKGTVPPVRIAPAFEPSKRVAGAGDRFGSAVALGRTRALVGAPLDDTDFTDQGSASGYRLDRLFRSGFE